MTAGWPPLRMACCSFTEIQPNRAQLLSSVLSEMNSGSQPSPVSDKLHVLELSRAGAPLIFLHGVGGTHRYRHAGPQAPVFPGHGTMLVDLLGFGDSLKPCCRYTVDPHLDALDVALAGQSQMMLVDHSMGAMLAVAYAARHPAWCTGYSCSACRTMATKPTLTDGFAAHPVAGSTPIWWRRRWRACSRVACVLRLATGRPNWHVALLDGVDHHPWLRQSERCRVATVRALGDALDGYPAGFYA